MLRTIIRYAPCRGYELAKVRRINSQALHQFIHTFIQAYGSSLVAIGWLQTFCLIKFLCVLE